MGFTSWLRNRKRPASPRPRPTFRPTLEALEGRLVLSTLTVTNNLDSGTGSLRAEISKCHSGDKIEFAPNLDGQTIKLTSGELLVNKNVTIDGPGAGLLAISAGGASRVFEVGAKEQVVLSGLTITGGANRNGYSTSGGGGVYNAGALTISACTLSGNGAYNGGAIYNAGTLTVNAGSALTNNNASLAGGAFYNAGQATIANSTISGNSCYGGDYYEGDGGGIYNNYGAKLTVSNSTLTGNEAGNRGGALFNNGTATVSGCTVTNNSDGVALGGGIYNYNSSSALAVSNSYFSANVGAATYDLNFYNYNAYSRAFDIYGPYTDGGGNTLY